jgi:hypothetical protein
LSVSIALGAWQGGLFFDLNGDYMQSFLNASIAGLVNLALLGLLCRYTNPRGCAGGGHWRRLGDPAERTLPTPRLQWGKVEALSARHRAAQRLVLRRWRS